ncbi:hypothetical protein EDF38_1906 [Frigoribacterium sp. PhB160]|nr:hypothetical protein EDF38_1906 [Frigoribacterium sp. PhB160]
MTRVSPAHRRAMAATAWQVGHILSTAPLVVVALTMMTYNVVRLVSLSQGRGDPSSAVDVGDGASAWPPFHIPGGVFIAMSALVATLGIEMWVRPGRTPSGKQPAFTAAFFFIDAEACSLYGLTFPYGDGGISWPLASAAVMFAFSISSCALAVRRRVVTVRSRRAAERAFEELLDRESHRGMSREAWPRKGEASRE